MRILNLAFATWLALVSLAHAQAILPDAQPLTLEGDIAAQLVDGVDRFLLREIDQSVAGRAKHWQRDLTSPATYDASVKKNRERLAHIIGLRDARVALESLEFQSSTSTTDKLAESPTYRVHAVRWSVLDGLQGEGLLLQPAAKPLAYVIVLPDADQTPEMLCGLSPGVAKSSQVARRLAEAGCQVIVPVLIDRTYAPRNARSKMTNREYIYRSAYELGRHVIGYEVQKSLALVDWIERINGAEAKIAVVGYGEGGMLAMYAAAVDPRIDATLASGCFAPREQMWQEPIDRNVFGLLEQFGGAELATLIAPRKLVVQASQWPSVNLPSEGGAPATLVTPVEAAVKQEFDRAQQLLSNEAGPSELAKSLQYFASPADGQQLFSEEALQLIAISLQVVPADAKLTDGDPLAPAYQIDVAARQARQLKQMDEFTQRLLAASDQERRQFININLPQYDDTEGKNRVDTSSVEAYSKSIERFRDYYREEVIGRFDKPLLAANPRFRKTHDAATWTGYEVMLDVFPDVFAYGILCVPKDLPAGEKRPVVVCQHGLEGRPQDIVTGDHPAYHDFASKLAERGFITFAPQNLYIGHDRFRTLQRKSYLLKKTLFSVIVPQHQQIVNWLGTLPFVDAKRIGFYGLSYGGKSAMRIPPLVPEYCLSICSADFNDWVWKNASTQSSYSYVWTNEYEIFEFDLGSKFNYAEMAALIAPRPFMVERGHFDGVGPDDRVASEFAKVRHLYNARLGIGDRCEIEFFAGPHTINGIGTFDFLHKHLNFPKPVK
ncbi:MAG: dienelactone hydrolase family protein [Pirellulaceae bacterium]|nr:dienelactone hydrolase family protein [Pirellulaceae bacterium]